MKITVGVSNKHLHLTEEDFKILFGDDAVLTKERDISQPGQFASDKKVSIESEKARFDGLRILGPLRSYTQVELSQTDCRYLGITAPIRWSGDVAGSTKIKIIGPVGSIEREAVIIPNRHIHIDRKTREELNLLGVDKVSLKVEGEKPALIRNVFLKEQEPSFFEVHLDTDDANANQIKNGDSVEIIIE